MDGILQISQQWLLSRVRKQFMDTCYYLLLLFLHTLVLNKYFALNFAFAFPALLDAMSAIGIYAAETKI